MSKYTWYVCVRVYEYIADTVRIKVNWKIFLDFWMPAQTLKPTTHTYNNYRLSQKKNHNLFSHEKLHIHTHKHKRNSQTVTKPSTKTSTTNDNKQLRLHLSLFPVQIIFVVVVVVIILSFHFQNKCKSLLWCGACVWLVSEKEKDKKK